MFKAELAREPEFLREGARELLAGEVEVGNGRLFRLLLGMKPSLMGPARVAGERGGSS